MLKLTIRTTRQITTADMRIAWEPPLVFEVITYINANLNSQMADWEGGGAVDAETAAELMAQCFMRVNQGGNSYPLNTKADALALRDVIEAAAPGQGDMYLCAILEGFIREHYSFFRRESPASENLQPASENGTIPAALPSER